MNIIGYSERGAMNALFYGIALNNDKGALEEFFKLAGITDKFDDFELFMEFSLSEYGDPDLVIIGKKPNGTKTVAFVEAKVSSCGTYDVNDQKNMHDDYIGGSDKYYDGHSSNLFFQLRLKECFFKRLKKGYFDGGNDPCSNYPSRLRQSRNRERKIGDNPIVLKIAEQIKTCDNAAYIAIIPQQPSYPVKDKKYEIDTIRYVSWENLQNKLNDYLEGTIAFNQRVDGKGKTVSQIFNN